MGACLSSGPAQSQATQPSKLKQAPGTPPDGDVIRASPSTVITPSQVSAGQTHSSPAKSTSGPAASAPVTAGQPGTGSGIDHLAVPLSTSPAKPSTQGRPALQEDTAAGAAEPANGLRPAPDSLPHRQAAAFECQRLPAGGPASGGDLVAKYLQHKHPEPAATEASAPTDPIARLDSTPPSPFHGDTARAALAQRGSVPSSPFSSPAAAREPARHTQPSDLSSGPAPPEDSVVTIAQAPPGVLGSGTPSMPYPPPFIPTPSMTAEPASSSQDWVPSCRRAVLVGCNYTAHHTQQLRGCANDMLCLADLLLSTFRYGGEDIVLLHDEQPYESCLPTMANIMEAVRWLAAAPPGASLLLAFSGRSTPLPMPEVGKSQDLSQHPAGGLLPCDFTQMGPIKAQELQRQLGGLPAGTRLHLVVDAGATSFPLGLPHHASITRDGWLHWEEDIVASALEEETAGAEAFVHSITRARNRDVVWQGQGGADVICFNSAPDYEGATEDLLGGMPSTGAVAFGMVCAVQRGEHLTYNRLARGMHYALKNGPQHFEASPDVTSYTRIDFNRKLVL